MGKDESGRSQFTVSNDFHDRPDNKVNFELSHVI